jgi:beta-glucosidase
MIKVTYHFPRGFLWGTATAAHQVEGNNTNNNWWAWEAQPGKITNGDKSGLACDWWSGRWREDFDRAAEARQNAHRLSIEWSRIQPAPDRWDEYALDRYREMLRGLYERNLTPLVTLHHFTDPIWVEERGGWENPEIVTWFTNFVKKAVEALREYASTWITINEPNVLIGLGYASDVFPPGNGSLFSAAKATANILRAHASAYRAIHGIQPQARVGMAVQIRQMMARTGWSPFDRLTAWMTDRSFNQLFPQALATGTLRYPFWRQSLPEVKGTQDFFGLNYYTRDLVNFSLLKAGHLFARRTFPKDADLSDTGFIANDPPGIYQALKWAKSFKLPIIITENGVENADDELRQRYILQHLHQVWRAVNFNWGIKGYFYWTLVDNFEWDRGWTQRYGLWELDIATQARRRRPSVDLYAEICKTNGISSEVVAQYAPEILDKLFPD